MDYRTDGFLGGDDVGDVMAVVANLATEVVGLAARVRTLEARVGAADPTADVLQEDIGRFVARVFSPMAKRERDGS